MKTESSRMQVKRYVAEDMRQALKLIREELGPDAVILSNKRIPGGVEILTTQDYDERVFDQRKDSMLAEQQATSRPSESHVSSASVQTPPGGQSQGPLDVTFETLLNQHLQSKQTRSPDEDLMAAMRSEIENLRLLLKDQMDHMTRENWGVRNPVEAAVLQRFEHHRISAKVAGKIARQVAQHTTIEEGWQAAMAIFKKQIPIAETGKFNQGVVALLGPTGAGKTTTLAKLAVRFALSHSRDELALVTTDKYRLAAYEQLKALGRILDVPVRLVDEQTSLNKVLRSLRDKSLVLIDTAGFQNVHDERQQQIDALESANVVIKKLLLLPCTNQDSTLRAAYKLVEQCGIDACVLSKTDETMSFGEVFSLVVEKALPVAYISNGQCIPDDLENAQADRLIRLLFEKNDTAGIHPSEIIKNMRQTVSSRMHAGL